MATLRNPFPIELSEPGGACQAGYCFETDPATYVDGTGQRVCLWCAQGAFIAVLEVYEDDTAEDMLAIGVDPAAFVSPVYPT